MQVKLKQPTGTPGFMFFDFDPKPDQNWVNRFNAKISKRPTATPLARNVKIQQGKLSLDCDINADLQAVVDQINKVVEEVNKEEADWDTRLKQIKV